MAFFDLFRRKPDPTPSSNIEPAQTPAIKAELVTHGSIIELPGAGTFAAFSRSPSGEWIVAWNASSEGEYVLYNASKNEVAASGQMKRPDQGCVADDGVFSIVEQGDMNALSGDFHLFSSTGAPVLTRSVTAIIYNSALSQNGKLAVFQTTNSQTSDGFRLFGFDAESGVELFSVTPPTGLASGYEFNEIERLFLVNTHTTGTFRYDCSGAFLDAEAYQKARFYSDNFAESIMAAQDSLKGGGVAPEFAREVIGVMNQALKNMEGEWNGNWDAIAHRVIGECHEILEDLPAALSAYKTAITLDPKIGVKRKITQLEKTIGSNPPV